MRAIKLAVLAVLSIFCTVSACAQVRILSGKVLDETLIPLAMANIRNPELKILGTTDMEGEFSVKVSSSIDTLLIAEPGYEWERIALSEKCNRLEVIILEAANYDYISLKRADRKIKRRRKKILPPLYQQAFENGLFFRQHPTVRMG